MKVEIRYPQATIGASGMRLYINDIFIPKVKEIKIIPLTCDIPTEGIKRTMLGCEIECKSIELIDDGYGIIATIIKNGGET